MSDDAVSFNPQPDPPAQLASLQMAMSRSGEVSALSPSLAARFDKLTLTSKIAPWHIFPHCFYSRQLVCETYTDCNGHFRYCFPWWPFHFCRGRLRFDSRPDILIRVTQVINGVEIAIYMDPYTSTRWNTTNAHIDLFPHKTAPGLAIQYHLFETPLRTDVWLILETSFCPRKTRCHEIKQKDGLL